MKTNKILAAILALTLTAGAATTTTTRTTTTNAASANYAHNYNYVAWDVWDEKPYSPDLIMLRPKENDYDDKVCVFSTIGCNSNSVTCTDVFFDREDYESDSFELRAVTWGYPNNYRIFADKKDQRNLGKIQYETIAVYENGMKKEIIGPRKADTVWNGTSYIYLHKNMTVYCNPDTKIYYYTSYNDYSDELQRVTCDKIGYFNSDGSITLLDNVIRLGDVNHDNIINMEDATIMQNHINNVKPIDEKFLWAADVNGDKVVDIEDVTAVIDHINGGESFEKKHENENYLILSDEDNITTVTTSTTTNTTSTTTTTPQVTSSGNKTHEPTEKEWGDTNCDGNLELADAILIMQSLANPDKYSISEQGRLNGDVDKSTKGLTANDALMIQEHLLGKAK